MFNIKKIPNTKYQIPNTKKGVTLYFAVVILSVIFGIGAGLSILIFSQIRITREIGESVIAFYAADTGIEQALYKLYINPGTFPFPNFSGTVGQASFEVKVFLPATGNCPSPPNEFYCIKSIGKYRQTQRAIEIGE